MKNSVYNLYIPIKNDEYALFNTLTNSIIILDQELKKYLEDEQFHELGRDNLANLESLGIVLEDDVDERHIYTIRYNQMVHSKKEMKFVIVTTYKCNLACPYCYEGMGEAYDKSMDENMAKRSIQAIKKHVISGGTKNLKIMLFGGEPLLNQNIGLKVLEDLSAWSKSTGVNFDGAIVTNGTLVTPEMIEKFSPYLHTVQLTLDGPRYYHDKIRVYKNGKNCEGTYGRILESLKLFRKAGVFVALRIQVGSENVNYLEELLTELRSAGVLDDAGVMLNFSPLKRLTRLCGSYNQFLEHGEVAVLPMVWKYGANQKPKSWILPCHVYSGLYIVDPYGDVYKCISTLGQRNDAVGNIRKGVFEFSYNFYDFMTRNPAEMPDCSSCVYLPMCGGGCPHMARMETGTYHASYCGSAKELLNKKILYYLERRYPEKFNLS